MIPVSTYDWITFWGAVNALVNFTQMSEIVLSKG
jgi:hypothetical protein